jgi:uncharacterized protein (UPF0276 family)
VRPFAPLGHGVGLRRPHWDELLRTPARVDFVELLADNFLGRGGAPARMADRVRATWPCVIHGVALSIGGPAPLDSDYLDAVAALARRTGARWYTDHVCFSNAFGVELHELLPLPFTREAVRHVVDRVRQVQARLGPDLPFGLENATTYLRFPRSDEMSEAEFLTEIVSGADCGLLLDVNNVYVNSVNHGFDPRAFIDALPLDRVMQVHLAGHEWVDGTIIDTHGTRMIPEVLDLYAYTLEKTGPVSTLVEWDHQIPPLEVLLAENDRVRDRATAVLGRHAPRAAGA